MRRTIGVPLQGNRRHGDVRSCGKALFHLVVCRLAFRQSDVERMNALAQKAAAETLTADESSEIAGYRHVGHLLALLQSKARLAQKRSRA